MRATREEVQLLRQAAAAAGSTLTAFIVSTALQEATMLIRQSTALSKEH